MRKGLIIGFICILLTSLLCYYNATQINTKQIAVRQEILRSQKIDEDTDGLLIAYFSDLYYGSLLCCPYDVTDAAEAPATPPALYGYIFKK